MPVNPPALNPPDPQKIQVALTTHGTELGIEPAFSAIKPQFNIHTFERLPSTSTQLWTLLEAGAGSGTVVIAKEQSSGRGQRGREWDSQPGGLYLSLALEPDWPVAHSGQLTCLSAWGIVTAFNNLGIPIEVKWPNDLFYEGKKLGGILTETKLAQSLATAAPSSTGPKPLPCIRQAVIGVGINWHNPVPNTGITLAKILELRSDLCAQNKINCLEMLAALVLRGILQGTFFYTQVGSQVFMKAYGNLLTQVGKTVSVSTNGSMPTIERLTTENPAAECPTAKTRLGNQSGEVMGVSEEGYLQVAVRGSPFETDPMSAPMSTQTRSSKRNILLIKPSEIRRA